MAKRRYWLVKSEPESYGIKDLERDGTTCWDGVRNYQARNSMRDDMQMGDEVLFYHSNADPPGVAGIAEVASAPYPDHTAFQANSPYFDPKSDPEDPRWLMVDLRFVSAFENIMPLQAIKDDPALADMLVVQRGQRLSVQAVEKKHFDRIVKRARAMAVAP